MKDPASLPKSKRFPGLDLLKLGFIVTIVIFHVWENILYQDVMELPTSQSFYTYYGKILSLPFHYAGPFLAGLSFFLFGYRQSPFSIWKMLAFLLGILIVQYTANDLQNIWSPQSWSWDVYSYLVVVYLLVACIPKTVAFQACTAVIGLLALTPSSHFYQNLLAPLFPVMPSVFILNPASNPPNGWFLFPWMFLPIALYGLGFLARNFEASLNRLRLWEIGAFILVFFSLFLNASPVPFLAGPRFYEFLFWQDSIHFWLHFVAFAFFLRVQFVQQVQVFFNAWPFQQIAKLEWIRHLWLCYFFHFLVLQVAVDQQTELKTRPFALDQLWIFVFLSTEIFFQAVFWIRNHYKKLQPVQKKDLS